MLKRVKQLRNIKCLYLQYIEHLPSYILYTNNYIIHCELGMNNGAINNANNVPSLSNIFNNRIIIQSHTTINEDGSLQTYCGLKLINIPDIGKDTNPLLNNLLVFLL